jgi:hypothetical protein
MYCPECKSEYRPGFTHCSTCDVDLVPELKPVLDDETEHPEPVVVYSTFSHMEAALMKTVLEGSGVEARLLDESLSRIDSPAALMIGGIKIIVPSHQEALARDILAQTASETN